jgi:hypothetical protein
VIIAAHNLLLFKFISPMEQPTQFMDPMDAVINQLQPRDTNANEVQPQPQPEQKPATPAPAPEAKPAEPAPAEPAKPAEPVPFDLDKEIDDLLNLVKKEPATPEIKEDVNAKPVKKEIKVPKVLEKSDNQELSVDEKEEITNYIYDLEEQLANLEFDKKRE